MELLRGAVDQRESYGRGGRCLLQLPAPGLSPLKPMVLEVRSVEVHHNFRIVLPAFPTFGFPPNYRNSRQGLNIEVRKNKPEWHVSLTCTGRIYVFSACLMRAATSLGCEM